MRIHRIHLQHVAGVDDRELTFDDGVTVVVGPNEAGKSTIATALQLLLEQKDRYDNADVRAVRPVHTDADPTIELECTTGSYHVTYRKVFGSTASRRQTTLTIHTPRAESLTGDAAHDRMRELLDATVDEQLWAALRVQQRHDVGQADLAASGALAAALDAAGTGASTLADDGTLVTRVDEAAAEFWTDTGKPRKPLQHAATAVEQARTELEEARAQLELVGTATDQHDALVGRIAELRAALPELQRRAKETAEAGGEVTAQRAAVAAAAGRVQDAEAAAARARTALRERAALVERLAGLGTVVEDREGELERARTACDEADQRVTDARSVRDTARGEQDEAAESLRAAEADVRLLRLDADADQLSARITRAEELLAQREHARARLDDRAPTADDISELERLQGAVRTAAAVLEADLPRVRVTGPAGTSVAIDDAPVVLGDTAVERAVDGGLTVQVGQVTVSVAPGASATELADAHDGAVRALRGALDAAGVADVAAAHERRDAARDAERELAQTDDEWSRVTASDGLDGMRAALDRTTATATELRDARPQDRPVPADVAEADRLVALRQHEADGARAAAATADAALEVATEAAATARTTAAEAGAKLEGIREQAEQATQTLEDARASASDDDLTTLASDAEEAATRAATARDEAAAALDALDVQSIEADADAAAARLQSTRQQVTDADLERARLSGTIESSAAAGLGERVPQLEAALTDAVSRHDGLHHRADALKLLRDTLHTHRDAARSRYQAPLKAEVERLGRVVFGEGFRVELDESLRVVERTLHGRTLGLEQLSGGAQEQLAIITRLAAASLVDTDDGVPLILDDALGYADPTRTDRVNTLLATVGRTSQVIVLTCDPDRFTGVPDARLLTIG